MYKQSLFTYWWWKYSDDLRNKMQKWSKRNNTQPTRVTTSITILSLSWKPHMRCSHEIPPESLKPAHERTHASKTHTQTVTFGNHKVQIRFLFFFSSNQIQETRRDQLMLWCSCYCTPRVVKQTHVVSQFLRGCWLSTHTQHMPWSFLKHHKKIKFKKKTKTASHFSIFLCYFKYRCD